MSNVHPPAHGPDLARWLDARVAAFDLAETVEAMRRGQPAPDSPPAAVRSILGADVAPLLADGFRALPDARLLDLRTHLTRHPDLLFDLQELIFLEGGPGWNGRLAPTAGEAPPELAALNSQAVDRVISRITAPPGRKPEAAPPRPRTAARAAAAAAVCLGGALVGGVAVGTASHATLTTDRAAASARQQALEGSLTDAREQAARDAQRWQGELSAARGEAGALGARLGPLQASLRGLEKERDAAREGAAADRQKWLRAEQDVAVLTAHRKDDAKKWAAEEKRLMDEVAASLTARDVAHAAEVKDLKNQLAAAAPKTGLFEPFYGTIRLEAGFEPDPFRVPMTTRGETRTLLGKGMAWVAREPDFRLNYTPGQFKLIFRVEAKEDTTLHVRTPVGHWEFDDDGDGGVNPRITFKSPEPGPYDIWVGTVQKKNVKGVLVITEIEKKQ